MCLYVGLHSDGWIDVFFVCFFFLWLERHSVNIKTANEL